MEYQDIYKEFHFDREGDFREEIEKYQEYLTLLNKNGLEQKEFEEFCEAAAQELKKLNKKKRELWKEKKIIEGYVMEQGIRETEQEKLLQERKKPEKKNGQEENRIKVL